MENAASVFLHFVRMFQQLLLVLTHRDQSLRAPTSKQTGIFPVSMLKMTGSIEAPPLRLSDRSHDNGGGPTRPTSTSLVIMTMLKQFSCQTILQKS